MTLPPYANTPIGRALIAEVLAARPEPRVRQHRLPSVYGGYPDGTSITYSGKPAALLRKLHREWWEANHEGATSLPENPDALIQRLIAEPAEQKVAA